MDGLFLADTIKRLKVAGIVHDIVDWPSSHRQMMARAADLSAEHQRWAIAIAKGELSPKYLSILATQEAARVLSIAADYNHLLISQGRLDRKYSKQVAHSIMKARLDLLSSTSELKRAPEDASKALHQWPIEKPLAQASDGHASGRSTVLLGHQDGRLFSDIYYRAAYHSFDDVLYGFNPGADVSVLNTGLRIQRDQIRLQHFDLIQVKSRTPVNDFFSPSSWDFAINYQQKLIANEWRHVGAVEYLRGKSYRIAGHTASALLGGAWNINKTFEHNNGLAAVARLSLLRQQSGYNYQLNYQQDHYLSGRDTNTRMVQLVVGIPVRGDLLSLNIQRGFSDRACGNGSSYSVQPLFLIVTSSNTAVVDGMMYALPALLIA